MKYLSLTAMAAALAFNSCDNNTGISDVKLSSTNDSLSYAFGVTIGEQLNRMGENVDLSGINYEILIRGIRDQRDSISAMEPEDANTYLDTEFERMYKAKIEGVNKPQAEGFISGKKAEAGVQSTASGLLYKVINQGSGIVAQYGDTVVVHYKGTFIDGEEFDSTEGGEPAEFAIEEGMIEGWNEGMMLMPEGSKFSLYIPWNLAYGERGRSPNIEPYTALVFDVEILKVKKAKG